MSTLAEIEAAVEALPLADQERLLNFLEERVNRRTLDVAKDPFASIIGAFGGAKEATGRKAEDILYGTGA